MYDASIDRVSIGIGKRNVHSCSFVFMVFTRKDWDLTLLRFPESYIGIRLPSFTLHQVNEKDVCSTNPHLEG